MSEEIEYPDAEHLRFWWDCQRKIAHPTRELAIIAHAAFCSSNEDQTPDPDLKPYLCPYGGHWHLGKERRSGKGRMSPSEIRKVWRKTRKRATLEQLIEEYRKIG